MRLRLMEQFKRAVTCCRLPGEERVITQNYIPDFRIRMEKALTGKNFKLLPTYDVQVSWGIRVNWDETSIIDLERSLAGMFKHLVYDDFYVELHRIRFMLEAGDRPKALRALEELIEELKRD